MNIRKLLLPCLLLVLATATSRAIDLKEAKVTQVVNDVQIISAADQQQHVATVDDVFRMPDVLHTGNASRAELVAPDETITRVGANTIFSFDPASRTIDLKQGSLLFHSPHGKGGGSIRTGSATASVLGTTLIVTTTPKGGLKVLDLEGNVEVKFLNGLKQKLDPGQMTFVLPGGDQLAPIIIFRLDELTKHSLLVKGFNQPLASLPLINSQMEKQLKLIQSGRATDTGLYAGDDAGVDKVEVFGSDTINHGDRRPGIVLARRADATINQASLTDASIPNPPNHVFTRTTAAAGNQFNGFLAKNISINTPASGLFLLTVDLSGYVGLGDFDFVADQSIHLAGWARFSGLAPADSLAFIAGKQITFASGIDLLADLQALSFSASAAMALDKVSIYNTVGDITMNSGADISVQNGSWVSANDNLSIAAGTDFNVRDSHLLGEQTQLSATLGDVSIDHSVVDAPTELTITSAGNSAVTRTSITTHYLTVNSGDGILLDGSGGALTGSGSGATASFTAPNLISVSQADFSSFSTVNMAANTINLSDVNLGAGVVTLRSALGLLNVGASQSGYVNFIQNVTYNGAPAQNAVNNGGGITVARLF